MTAAAPKGGGGAAAAPSVIFSFELQLLLRPPRTVAAALACLSLQEGGVAPAAAAPRACFNRFAEQLRGGLLRTGRKWRRRAAAAAPGE